MAAPMLGIGFFELLIVLFGGGTLSGGGVLGLPPGERDAKLIRCAAADSVLYVEWAARSAGQEGAPGIDGLAADPEIRQFLKQVDKAIRERLDDEGDVESPLAPQLIYPIVRRALLKPGCVFVSLDAETTRQAIEKGGSNGESFGQLAATGVRAALVVSAGKDAEDLEDEIRSLLATFSEEGEKPEDLQFHELPGPPGITPILHRHESYFVLGLNKSTVESVVAGLSGKSDGLTKNAAFAAGLKNTAVERVGCVSWFDLATLLDKLSEGLGPQGAIVKGMAGTIGLDGVKSVTSTTGVTKGEIHQRSFVATSGKAVGLLALTGGRSLTPADLAHIPADADMAVAFSVDIPKVFMSLKAIAKKADPGALKAIERAVEQMEADIGLSLESDLFPAVGDVWSLHNSPDAGGILVTGAVLSLEIRDRKKAEGVLAKLLAVLDQALRENHGDGETVRDEHEFLGHSVTTFRLSEHGPPFQPAFCLTDRHLLVAPQPQAIKAHLRSLKSKKPGLDSRWSKELLQPEGEIIATSYVDSRTIARLLTALLPYWGKSAVQELSNEGVEFSHFDIPSAGALLPYVTPAVSAMSRTPGGLHSEHRGGLPVPGGLTPLLGILGRLSFVSQTIHEDGRLRAAPPGGVARPAAAVVRPLAVPVIRVEAIAVPARVEGVRKVEIEVKKK